MQQVSLWKSPLSRSSHTEEKHSRVKMAVMKFLIYVTCFGLSQDLVFCDDFGESGKEITLTPSIRGKPEEILWTLNSNKVLEYDGSQVEKFGSFKDRVEVDFETGQLTIRKLNSQDSGRYQSEIWINKKLQVSSHNLTVLDALPEPQVTCEPDETTNHKKLTCSVESQTQLSYEWIGPDVKQTGPTLLVKENEENRNPVYTCTVKNKAGTRTTDFALQDCHTVNLAVLVPVLIIVLLLIIVLAVLAFCLYRRKKQKYAKDVGKAELKLMDTENGVCDTLIENVEAVPGSLEATLPCRTRLTPPKESIADKKWGQGSESENGGETHEKLLKESLQSAKTENEETEGNTNEGELEMNQENCQNADEAEENATSKADEREEIQKQTQEGIEKSQKLKDESEDEEESPGEQDTTDTDTIDEDQTPKEKEDEEEENSPNTAEENANSKADEREVEIQKYSQTQEEMQKWKNDSEDKEESSEEQIETSGKQDTTNADTNEQDQTPEEKKDEENKYKGMDSLSTGKIRIEALGEQDTTDINDEDQTPEEKEDKEEENKDTVYTGDVAEQLHENEKSSQNENRDQQNKSLYRSVEEDDRRPEGQTKEEEKTEKENHEGTGRPHTAEPCNPPLHSEAPSDPVDSPPNLNSVLSSNLNIELENKQTAFVPQQEDDDGEQTDKSSESKKDVATA